MAKTEKKLDNALKDFNKNIIPFISHGA